MGTVPHAAPAGRVEVLPDAPQADGHPLAQQRVGVAELLQADGDQVALEAGFLWEGRGHAVAHELRGAGAGACSAMAPTVLRTILTASFILNHAHFGHPVMAGETQGPAPHGVPGAVCSGHPPL